MIQANAGQFRLDIAQWAEKAKGKLREFAVETIQDINEEVVQATPVKTGFLRGSWWAALNARAAGNGAPDPSGSTAVGRMNASMIGLKLGDVYHANNGANYAVFVEFGTSKMAPRAFVRGALDHAPAIAEAAAARVASAA